jgi:hypothetical protein
MCAGDHGYSEIGFPEDDLVHGSETGNPVASARMVEHNDTGGGCMYSGVPDEPRQQGFLKPNALVTCWMAWFLSLLSNTPRE